MVTPQFLGLVSNNEKVELQTIKCNVDAEDLVTLNTIDDLGAIVDTYCWTSVKGKGYCWVDAETMDPPEKEVLFDPGQGFWVQSDEGANVFQSSGQVGVKDVLVTLTEGGATLCGNGSPAKVNLQDILCNEDAEDLVTLNTIDELGAIVDTYCWTSVKGKGYCWVDAETMDPPEKDVLFDPGQAFWVQSDEGENTITFPAVEL